MSPRFSTLAASVLLSPAQARRRVAPPPALRLLASTNPADGPPSPRLHATRRRVPPIALLPVAYRGSYLRRLLAPRRPVEHVLLSVIQQTYLAGSSTRTVDALAESVGVPGTDPIVVEAQASDWDFRVEVFRQRHLKEAYPYLMLAETPALVRDAGPGAASYPLRLRLSRAGGGPCGPGSGSDHLLPGRARTPPLRDVLDRARLAPERVAAILPAGRDFPPPASVAPTRRYHPAG